MASRRTARGRKVLAVVAGAFVVVGSLPLLGTMVTATPATDGNPDLPASCGLDVTLVLDDSGSIDAAEAEQVRQSAQAFADGLVGTPSRLKTVVFSRRAQGVGASGALTSVLSDVVFRDPALYTPPTSGAGFDGTNWDDGLEVVRRSNGGAGDLVVFITDGDPTFRNTVTPNGHLDDGTHSISGTGSSTSSADLSQAVTEANLIKASGAKMFGIGVGLTSTASKQRLNDVTGDEEMTITGGVPAPPFGEADFIVTPDFDDLEAVVSAFVRELCADSVNVTKFLQRADGSTVKAGSADPWTFDLTLDPAPTAWNNPPTASGASASLTSNGNGGVSFTWDQGASPRTYVADLVETPKPGWVYNGARCSVKELGGATTPLFDTVGTNAPNASGDAVDLLDLDVPAGASVNCEIYNREIRPSTVEVLKQTVPAGLAGEFDFELRQGATVVDSLADLSHGESASFAPVAPGTYSVVEAAAPGFTQTSAVCDDLGTPAVETQPASGWDVGEGKDWRCRFTNTANDGTITVVKQAIGAEGTFPFTSNVPGLTSFSLTTSGGSATSSTVTVPVGTYSITEAAPSRWTLIGATCTGDDAPSSVNVGPGEDVVCTFTNVAPAPSIRVVKSAGVGSVPELGGPVDYTVAVTNTSVEPVTITGLTDSIEGGPALDLTTVAGPILATDCDDLVGDTLAIGATGTCTFTAQVSVNAGPSGTPVRDVVTATAVDSDDDVATANDDATVLVTPNPPNIAVTKAPSVPAIDEPGDLVTYTVGVKNTGVEPVTITSITDSVEGGAPMDVTQVTAPLTATTCDALIGVALAPQETRTCTFTILHEYMAADVDDGFVDDTVTVVGQDNDGTVTETADAQVAVNDLLPQITVVKTANPTIVDETGPGQTRPVTYTVEIANDTAEPVRIDAITDSVNGGPAVAVGGTCAPLVGTWLAAGASTTCTFSGTVSGPAGTSVVDVVRVAASDDEANVTFDNDDATVALRDVASSIQVTKTAGVASVPENGGPVTYAVTVRNTSPTDRVTLASLVDSVDGGPPVALNGTCAALVGTVLAPNQQVSCSFTKAVSGNAGDTVTDVVTVRGTDDDGAAVADDDDASVAITDLPSSITVEKIADVESLPEPGGLVTYTVRITNASVADSVTIDSIVDSVDGAPATPVAGSCTALLGAKLTPGQSRTCTFTATVGTHTGDIVANTVTVAGTDDDGRAVSAKGSETVTITDVASSLSVTKQHDVASVAEPGGPVNFTVTIANTSAVDSVTIDSITDAVDGGTPFDVEGTCDDLIGTVLDAGDSVSCEFTVDVAGNAGDVVSDVVTVSGTDDDQQPVSAQATENLDITDAKPTVTIEKTAAPTSVPETAPGATQTITYTLEITNTSPEPVTITSLVDAVDGAPATPIATGTCATAVGTVLPVDGSLTCTFTAPVAGNAGDTTTDVATVGVTDDEQNLATDDDDATVTFTDVASSLLVTKSADVESVPEPGAEVTFTVEIENTSPTDDVTIDQIVDQIDGGSELPAGGTCTALLGTTLAPSEKVSCTFTVLVGGDPGDVVGDTVTVRGTDDDGTPVSDSGSEVVDVVDVESSLLVTKSADVTSVLEPGGPVAYTVTIENTSTTDDVTIDAIVDSVDGGDPFDVGGTCGALVGTTLTPGQEVTCTFTLDVTGDAGDTVRDTVTVTGTDDDDGPVTGSGSDSVEITDVLPVITVTKTASPSVVPETAPGTTQEITYTVTIQNDSPEPVTIEEITDSVDGGAPVAVGGTCAALIGTTLDAQAGTSCEFTAQVAGNAGDTTTDEVVVSAADDDDNLASDADDATVTFTDVASSLLVTKDADAGSVPEPGGPVAYTVTIENTSPTDAVTIDSITDAVGGGTPIDAAGTCPALIGTTLAPGASASCTFTLDVTGDAGDTVTDLVTVTGTDDDDGPVSDDATESVDITDVASSLLVTKVADLDSVPENGGPVTYTVTIENTSPADDVTIDAIVDSVDGGDPFDVGGTCAALVGTTLTPGQVVTCSFTLDVAGNAGDSVADTVTVTGTDDDDAPVEGSGSEVVDLTDVASALSVTKEADVTSVPEPGGSVTYTVTIENTSTTDDVTIDAIVDSVDGGDPFDVGGTCAALVGTTLTPGQTVTCTFTLDVTGDAGDVVGDTVTVTGTDDDGTEVTDGGSEVVDITDVPPSGTVTKVADPASVAESGGTVTFTVTITNTSTAEPATITSITDSVDGGEPFEVGGTCAALIGTSLAPGASTSCTFEQAIPPGTAGDVVTDTIAVTLADDDGNDTTPTDTEEVPLTDVAPTIVVTKASDPDSVPAPGAEVDFDVTIVNTSWEPVTVTSITDAVDGGTPFDVTVVADPVVATTCATGVEIAPGGTYGCSFTLVVASDEAATVPDEVVATVVDDDGTEATAGDAAVTTVTAVADLAIEKRLLDEALIAGEEATYELAVTNLGPSTAAGVVVTDTVPEPLVPRSGSGEGWTCTVDEQVVRCTTESLAPESTSVVQVRVEVPADAAALEVTNVGEVVSDTEDPDDENNRDEVTHEVGDAEPIDEDRPPPAGPIDAVIVATGGPQGFLAMVGALTLIAGMAAIAARRLAEDRRG